MPVPREQLRLTPDELDDLCGEVRTIHVSTVSPDGTPHVAPMWFVWHDGSIWVNSLKRSRRARDVDAGSKVAVCIDAGERYGDLRGAVFYGRFHQAPGGAVAAVRGMFARRYFGADDVPDLKSHAWLRLDAERVVSWDFRKIPQGRDRRLERDGA